MELGKIRAQPFLLNAATGGHKPAQTQSEKENNMKDYSLDITIKITNDKGLIIGRTYYLFNKPRVAVGLWNNSVVFATNHPRTMGDTQVLIYTTSELKEIYNEGSLQGLANLEQLA